MFTVISSPVEAPAELVNFTLTRLRIHVKEHDELRCSKRGDSNPPKLKPAKYCLTLSRCCLYMSSCDESDLIFCAGRRRRHVPQKILALAVHC